MSLPLYELSSHCLLRFSKKASCIPIPKRREKKAFNFFSFVANCPMHSSTTKRRSFSTFVSGCLLFLQPRHDMVNFGIVVTTTVRSAESNSIKSLRMPSNRFQSHRVRIEVQGDVRFFCWSKSTRQQPKIVV